MAMTFLTLVMCVKQTPAVYGSLGNEITLALLSLEVAFAIAIIGGAFCCCAEDTLDRESLLAQEAPKMCSTYAGYS